MTETLAGSPLAHAIGLALLHFLWQGAAIGAVTAIVLIMLRRSSAQARYVVACAGLTLMIATPIVTIASEMRDRASAQATSASLPIASGTATNPASGSNLAQSVPATTLTALQTWLESQLPLVVLLYSVGVLVLALHLLRGWMRISRIQRQATVLECDAWPDAVRRMADRLGITRRVRLIESALVEVPAVIGCLRPAIVVPVSALAGLPPAHLEAILAHELAHVRRGDYLINVIQCVVEVLLFYHPAVWWVSRQIRIEREHCCDDVAASICPDRVSYAHALVSLEELRGTAPAFAMAANGGDLLRRIRRLVEPGSASGPTFSGRFAMCVALTVALLIAVSGHMQELPAVDDRPQMATVQPAAEPAPTPSAAPMATPAPEAPRLASPAPRSPRPAPTPAAAPAPEPESRAVAAPTVDQTSQGSLTGVVKDQTGGTLPGVTVTVTSPTSTATHTTVTNPAGQFSVPAVPGEYDLTVRLAGFKTSRSRVQVTAGQTTTAAIRLDVGSLSESVTVVTDVTQGGPPASTVSAKPLQAPRDPKTADELLDAAAYYYQQKQPAEAEAMMTRALALLRPATAPPVVTMAESPGSQEPAGRPTAIRVGGDIREPRKLKDVKPVYPAEAATAGVTGVVIIDATIGKDGLVSGARVLRGNPLLDQAALSAVREWRFTPTLLNGVPTDVTMTVTVTFATR